jgi:hypothetical protein
MIPMKHDNNKPAVINGGGLGGLDHVGRKSPKPRPAPANLMNPSNQSLVDGLGMTTNQIRNTNPTGTSQNRISPTTHNRAVTQGFPAKRNMGLSMPKPKTLGFFLILSAVTTASAYYYRRRNLADKLADEEDDSE